MELNNAQHDMLGTRVLTSSNPDCVELTESLTLTMSIMIDPHALLMPPIAAGIAVGGGAPLNDPA